MKKVLTILFFLIVSTASACTCIYKEFSKKDYTEAAYIVKGEIVKIEVDEEAYERIITLKIFDSYKGDHKKTMKIRTGLGGGDCGLYVTKGDKWLLFVNSFNGKESVSICEKNIRYTQGEEETEEEVKKAYDTMKSYIKKIKKYKREK